MSVRHAGLAVWMISVLVASSASATAPEPPAASLGCCVETQALSPLDDPHQVTLCSVFTAAQCSAQSDTATLALDFEPGQVCNASFDACEPFVPPGIVTSASLAHRPEDCYTDKAFGILGWTQGQEATVCAQICNETGITLTHLSLNIDPFFVPEFSNLPVHLPHGTCTSYRKSVGAFVISKFIGDDPFLRVINQWCAANGPIPPGGCTFRPATDDETGSVAGPGFQISRDEQSALLVRQPAQGAPALGGVALGVLAAALAAFGVRRLIRRRA